MNADTLARLAREAEAPEGIAVRVSGPEMKRLLEERSELRDALAMLFGNILDEVDITNSGGPNQAMRLVNDHGPRVERALARSGE